VLVLDAALLVLGTILLAIIDDGFVGRLQPEGPVKMCLVFVGVIDGLSPVSFSLALTRNNYEKFHLESQQPTTNARVALQVLRSLTSALSHEMVYALTIICFGLHLALFDYPDLEAVSSDPGLGVITPGQPGGRR
jgi:hypothetical protein